MREQLSVSPKEWLLSQPIPIPFASSVISAYRPNSLKVIKFKGPHNFYRAAGWDSTKGELASAYGGWWADESELVKINSRLSMFENWLPKELMRKALPAQYRGATALCEDWNDMREMFKLVLPVSDEIIGLVGIAAKQPLNSKYDPRSPNTPMLPGGAEQVFFKKTKTLNSINPLWVHSERLW